MVMVINATFAKEECYTDKSYCFRSCFLKQ